MITYESIASIIDNTTGLLHKHDETKLLFDLASQAPQGHNILEIGSYCGLSSLCLAFGALNSYNRLYCVTQWQEGYSLEWRKNINSNRLDTTVIYGDANQILADISFGRLSVAFIDANHIYKDIKMQFEAIRPSLAHKAVVAFHDYGKQYPDVKEYCDELVLDNVLCNAQVKHCTFYGKVDKYRNHYN